MDDGLRPSIYSHPLPYYLLRYGLAGGFIKMRYGAGPGLGGDQLDEPAPLLPPGGYPVHANTTYAMELQHLDVGPRMGWPGCSHRFGAERRHDRGSARFSRRPPGRVVRHQVMSEARTKPDTLPAASKAATLGLGTMGLLFVFGAAVQYNDPDPYSWAVLYLAAAGVSFAALWLPEAWKMPASVAVVAFIWAAALAPAAARTSFPDLFQSWEMMSIEMEEGREFLGLLLIAAWSAYLAHRGRNARQRSGPREEQS